MGATFYHTADMVAEVLVDVGFHGWQVHIMGCICPGECGPNRDAYLCPRNEKSDKPTSLSIDFGLFGINGYYFAKNFPNMPAEEAMIHLADPLNNAKEARRLFVVLKGETSPVPAYEQLWMSYPLIRKTDRKIFWDQSYAAAKKLGQV